MNGPIRRYPFSRGVPEGDDRERWICETCGWIHYRNPLVVVGSVVVHENRVLLCKRAIEPRKGFWTIPAGYMEEGESCEAGAAREAWEEANAHIRIHALLGVYSIPHISQVQMIYTATFETPGYSPGVESEEVRLFEWADIPWDHLAFPSVTWSLRHYDEVRGAADFPPFRLTADR